MLHFSTVLIIRSNPFTLNGSAQPKPFIITRIRCIPNQSTIDSAPDAGHRAHYKRVRVYKVDIDDNFEIEKSKCYFDVNNMNTIEAIKRLLIVIIYLTRSSSLISVNFLCS